MLIELLTVVAVVAFLDGSTKSWSNAALVAVAWGSTAFVGLHQAAEFIAIATFSGANWDVPPSTGYLTVAGLGIAGVLTLAYAIRGPRSVRQPVPAEYASVEHPV